MGKAKRRTRRALTKKLLDSLKPLPSGRGAYRVYDATLRGFFATVLPSGRINFGVRYGGTTRRRWHTFGDFGVLTVELARERARHLLSEYQLGGDPSAEKKRRANIPGFTKWMQDYVGLTRRTHFAPRQIERHLERAAAEWKNRPLDEIRPEDVERLRADSPPAMANRFVATLSACFRVAKERGFIKANPCASLEHYPEKPIRRKKRFTDEELGRLLDAMDQMKDTRARAWLRLLMETGCRPGEARLATWDQFDLTTGIWLVPPTTKGRHKKNRQPRPPEPVLLHPVTVAWLRELEATKRGPYLIPGFRTKLVKTKAGRMKGVAVGGMDPEHPRSDFKNAWRHLCQAAGLTGFVPYNVRHTFLSLTAKHGGALMAKEAGRHADFLTTLKSYVVVNEDEKRETLAKVIPFLTRQAG